MPNITIQVGKHLAGLGDKKKKDDPSCSSSVAYGNVYTGVLEKYELPLEHMVIVRDTKGNIVALTAPGDQVLPFETITVSPALAAGYLERYKRRLQGYLLKVVGERPKGRS